MEPTCRASGSRETLVEAAARELWEETGISARRNTLFVCISGLRQIKRRFCFPLCH